MNKKMKIRKWIDKSLIVSIVAMVVSGFMIGVTGDSMAVILLHKLSAVIFCVLSLTHILQYKRRKGKRYVSQKAD